MTAPRHVANRLRLLVERQSAPAATARTSAALPLPPPKLRWGGSGYRDDEFYRQSGARDARILQELCGLSTESRVLDIGCGQARVLTGILQTLGTIRQYVGLDVHEPSIDWCTKNLARENLAFHRIDVCNERYNPKGNAETVLPVPAGAFDVVCMFSVFSHMHLDTIEAYLREIRRVLAPGGQLYTTAFVELGVPDEQENPPDYNHDWTGAMHCIRLERHFFERLAHDAGLQVRSFNYRTTTDGQSSYVLERNDDTFAARVAPTGAVRP